MSKRGATERDFAASQGNVRKARVEVRRVDAFQVLMAAARARGNGPQQQSGATATVATTTHPGTLGAVQPPVSGITSATHAAPCTHCGTVLPVSIESCSLRQCCACLDVFCSLCSVLDYEEREDRVFCLGCLEDQASACRAHRSQPRGPAGTPGGTAAASLSLPITGSMGRWGQVDMLGGGGPARSPFPCSRTLQNGQGVSRRPGSAFYSSRSHRGFSALLAYAGVES